MRAFSSASSSSLIRSSKALLEGGEGGADILAVATRCARRADGGREAAHSRSVHALEKEKRV